MQHEYVFGPSGTGSFAPRFSYHEVHFLVIVGLSEAPAASSIIGHRVGNIAALWPATKPTAAERGGGRARLADFSCSNPLLERIYNQSLWTKSNLVTGGMRGGGRSTPEGRESIMPRTHFGLLGGTIVSNRPLPRNVMSLPIMRLYIGENK